MENNLTFEEVYDYVGGDQFFQSLVDIFYKKVENDELLLSIFPRDLSEGKKLQYLFLRQRFGGPREYAALRGEPAHMRKRHMPYKITIQSRNIWLSYMIESLKELNIKEGHPAWMVMNDYFERISMRMVNQNEFIVEKNEIIDFKT
ncbi:MAG: globin [Candidatus Heimdallarchaeota archaeon]|nr:globin [Candidatus Heimdallarchaeota archaeon]MDH5644936.1 globin [Candidatus Heimdallarchaeota archaeon]